MTTSSEIKLAIEKFVNAYIDDYKKKYEKKKTDNEKKGKKPPKYEPKFENLNELIHNIYKLIEENALSFATHSAKHIHSSSKSDNVKFVAKADLPENLLGSQTILDKYFLDVFRGATNAPYCKFFEIKVNENGETITSLLLDNNPILEEIFPPKYLELFQKALQVENPNPKSDERNKQILWYCPEKNDYIGLVPLYPVELAYKLNQKIRPLDREERKDFDKNLEKIRKLRKDKKPYLDISGFFYAESFNLATTIIGGDNAQNVSEINTQLSGKYYLIPSIPPNFKNSGIHFSKRAKSFFCNELIDREIRQLFVEVVESEKNNLEVRNKRQEALDLLCAKSLTFAQRYREQKANWTNEYSLSNTAEIYWLDPNNSKFSEKSNIPLDWQEIIAEKFASWLMSWFKNNKTFANQKDFFSDAEYMEFLKTFKRAISLGD